jgi:putative redox protein
MDAKVTWKREGLSFDGVADSGFVVPMGTSVEHGGADDGARPMEMVLMALGGCTAFDVVSILKKKKQDITDFEILVHGNRASEHPMVYTDITLEYVVTGHALDPEAVHRAVELSETKYCSVSAMLRQAAKLTIKITVKEAK